MKPNSLRAIKIKMVQDNLNTQAYERWIIPIYFVLAYGTMVVAAVEGGRFRWPGDMPVAMVISSYIIYLFGNLLVSWAVNANAFFSAESRLRTDRHQTVTSASLMASPVTQPTWRLSCSGLPQGQRLNRGGRCFQVYWLR